MGNKDFKQTKGYGEHEHLLPIALSYAEKFGVTRAAEKYNLHRSTIYAWRKHNDRQEQISPRNKDTRG